eukprot:1144286-Pelagomonas_calceolata.AAC.4
MGPIGGGGGWGAGQGVLTFGTTPPGKSSCKVWKAHISLVKIYAVGSHSSRAIDCMGPIGEGR